MKARNSSRLTRYHNAHPDRDKVMLQYMSHLRLLYLLCVQPRPRLLCKETSAPSETAAAVIQLVTDLRPRLCTEAVSLAFPTLEALQRLGLQCLALQPHSSSRSSASFHSARSYAGRACYRRQVSMGNIWKGYRSRCARPRKDEYVALPPPAVDVVALSGCRSS